MTKLHQVFLNISSSAGDRIVNILEAVQLVQTRGFIRQMSAFYEYSEKALPKRQLNRVCYLKTELQPEELLYHLTWIEKRICSRNTTRNGDRAIKLDILLFDDVIMDTAELTIPHPLLARSVSILKPLFDIAPQLALHPESDVTVKDMLAKADLSKLTKVEHGDSLNLADDAQNAKPAISVALSRVGVANLSRIILISKNGTTIPFHAELDFFADLKSNQAGVHMSRFSDVLEEIVDEFTQEPSSDIESLAERLAQQVLKSQEASYSEVHIRGKSALKKTTPISGKDTHEIYSLIGIAAASHDHARKLVGIETEGVTACPCAQGLMRTHSENILKEEGFSASESARILKVLPAPSHNQRGRGTLIIGSKERVAAENLVHIVEASMSSETYELLKRSDEFMVVNKAHHNPRFVEDVVREMLLNVAEILTFLPDDAFVLAKQVNFEGIHKHDAYAERHGLLGDIRAELNQTGSLSKHISLHNWLRGYN